MNIFVAILALSVLIIVHELGHFIVAKLSGIKVLEFSLFMGPKLFSVQRGETIYSLRAIPLGGYVKMEGEEEASEDERAFNKKPKLIRIAVLVAGALANILFAVAALSVITMYNGFSTTVVDRVLPGSMAEKAGILPGDRIISYDGKRVYHENDLYLFIYGSENRESDVKLERNGKIVTARYLSQKIPEHTQYRFGITASSVEGEDANVITYVEPKSPAALAGLTKGDRIVKLNDTPIKQVRDMQDYMKVNKDAPVDITVVRTDGRTEVLPDVVPYGVTVPAQFDISFSFKHSRGGFFESIKQAGIYSYSLVRHVIYSLSWLITQRVSLSEMMGPVGIVSAIGDVVEQGSNLGEKLTGLFWFAAMISINLGVFNLIPFPALDGSKVLLIVVEAIRKKALAPEKEALITMVGFVILILLMLFTTYHDILRIAT